MNGTITGNIAPGLVPLASGWDSARLAAFKATDDDPLEILAQIAPGAGSKGQYAASAVQRFVEAVSTKTLAGYLGHTRPEDFSTEFRLPAVHWLGAVWDGSRALFRGVVDKSAGEVKRLIRAGRLDAVSIHYGDAKVLADGKRTVVDLVPLSIDLVPLGRQGMADATIVGMETKNTKNTTSDVVGELVQLHLVKRDVFSGRQVWTDSGQRRTGEQIAGVPLEHLGDSYTLRRSLTTTTSTAPPTTLRITRRSI